MTDDHLLALYHARIMRNWYRVATYVTKHAALASRQLDALIEYGPSLEEYLDTVPYTEFRESPFD